MILATSKMRPLAPRLVQALSRATSRRSTGVLTTSPSLTLARARPVSVTTTTLSKRLYSSTPTLLPEFSLKNKTILVSGGGRGLGLVQSEALLEAGATVHAIDLLPDPTSNPDSEFSKIASRAKNELGTSLTYHKLDVRDTELLNQTVEKIADEHGQIDGLIAAAGIQQETSALEYSREDCDKMLGVNVTGVFMTAQAVARQMVRKGNGGSLVLIGSMSGTVANRGLICP